MLRKTKLIYIMGSAVIGVLTVLTVLFAMISTGVIDGRQKKVVFASASAVFTYDGQEHTETQWEIKDGELKSGHTAKVVVSGTQTEVGESVNHISGVILDEQGADVTSDYVIEYAPGTLAVKKRAIGVRSGDGVKNYDGTPLTCDEYEIADGDLAEGQTLECRVTGSIVAAGSQENSFVATIRDEKGNDKTENYAVTYLPGTLTVNRRKVVFGSVGAEKDYDGNLARRRRYLRKLFRRVRYRRGIRRQRIYRQDFRQTRQRKRLELRYRVPLRSAYRKAAPRHVQVRRRVRNVRRHRTDM